MSPAERLARASAFPPIYLHAIAWWDEHHKKTILGFTSRTEYRIYRDPAGNAATASTGGTLVPPKPNTTTKFPGEARGLFGVAMVRNSAGQYVGKKAAPFNYTGCRVVSFLDFEKAKLAELKRVNELKRVSGCTCLTLFR